MKKALLLLALFVVFAPHLIAEEPLAEANASFTYQGKPIHPFLVREFSNWLSDYRPPMIATVDVAAAFDTNKYQQSTIEKKEDWWFSKREEMVADFMEYESFEYRWLGKMANGIHVLETGESGGGSGTFMNLMFFRFSEGEIMFEDKKKENQLLMSIVGIYSLGDRYEGKIEVLSDRALIHASPSQRGGGSIEKDVELKFPA